MTYLIWELFDDVQWCVFDDVLSNGKYLTMRN
jgi:hypothetical protein